MVVSKCPYCRKKQTEKPLRVWTYSHNIQVRRFECSCGEFFNFYKTNKNTWTIPKEKNNNSKPSTVFLQNNLRLWLFSKAYSNEGSLSNLALTLGYSGKGKNGSVRNMWFGKYGIPIKKFVKLCETAKISESNLLNHVIPEKDVKLIKDWRPIIDLYKNNEEPPPEIFEKFFKKK